MSYTVVKNIDKPDKTFTFLDGSVRKVVITPTSAIGWGEYKPGWRWSKHVKPMINKDSAKHIGYVVSGYMLTKSSDGQTAKAGPGDVFEVSPGHDAWVFGDEPCTAMDFESLE